MYFRVLNALLGSAIKKLVSLITDPVFSNLLDHR